MSKPQATPEPSDLAVGESRVIELYAIRLDVTNFEEIVTKEDILQLPKKIRENLWLYNLDITGKSGTPRLLDNALAQIRSLPDDDPSLTLAERNMERTRIGLCQHVCQSMSNTKLLLIPTVTIDNSHSQIVDAQLPGITV